MTKFLRNELTNDNAGSTGEDQQDNIGKICKILGDLFVITFVDCSLVYNIYRYKQRRSIELS